MAFLHLLDSGLTNRDVYKFIIVSDLYSLVARMLIAGLRGTHPSSNLFYLIVQSIKVQFCYNR